MELEGVVLRAIKPELLDPFFREVELRSQATVPYNAIGPGVEIEMDVTPRGPFRPALYLNLYGYRVLGDRSVALTDTVEITDQLGGPDSYRADWTFRVAPWIIRAGLGVRLRWPVK